MKGFQNTQECKKTAVIIASRSVTAGMLRYVPQNAHVITADAGWQNAVSLGLHINLAVGDFDSSVPPTCADRLLHLPTEKDDTDTFFALKQAISLGYESLVLLGALGGRQDHHFANMQCLLYATKRGVHCMAACEDTEIYCVGRQALSLERREQCCVSVFAAEESTAGVSLQGLKYTLNDATLYADTPLGQSNEFAAENAQISCKNGYLFVIVAKNT